ncbi:MAG: YigZ family protein [Ruminiclostridium sp.]|nr:YigZ family protein [Ruminiclostridium sp.]MBR4111594.1 YigZ family protein [Ruminiclostridium sp.]
MGYKTINGSAEARFIEKKSEFIGYIRHTETEAEAIAFINEIRAMHRKATHNCYAYMLRDNNTARHSDDGEPGGTAGVPIYEVLRKEGLIDVTCVVTRYFGGIMLGAGGLVRAYTQGAKIAVEAAEILNMCTAARLTLKLDYSLYGKIGKTLTDFDVRTEKEDFGADVEITLCIRSEDEEKFSAALVDLCNGSIIIKKLEELEYNFG